MSKPVKHFYEFGPFCIDPVSRLLRRDGQPVALTPKAFDLLLVLIENSGQVLDKDELMRLVWPETVVEENNLTRNIATLRKTLGEHPGEHRYIVTVPGRGYGFVAGVEEVAGEEAEVVVARRSQASLVIQEEKTNGTAMANTGSGIAAPVLNRIKSHKKGAAIALAILIVTAGGVGFGLYQLNGHDRLTRRNQPSGIVKLTTSGKALRAAISPDGKYVAYLVSDAGQQSLWVRQVATSGNVQVAPPAQGVRYLDLTFSRDGNHIYYVKREGSNPATLYHMPVLGGAAGELIENVGSFITLSPDEQQIAFVRSYPDQQESALMVANLDGSGERRLATRQAPEDFNGAAWSPDGKTIACVGGSYSLGVQWTAVAVQVDSGVINPITSKGWFFGSAVAWLPDGSGLIVSASDYGGAPFQLWHLSYPGGEARRITNDFNIHFGVSLTADARTLVTAQEEQVKHVWIVPDGDTGRAKQVTFGTSRNWAPYWAPDGKKLIYTSNASGNWDIWMMDADGNHQKQLTVDAPTSPDPAVWTENHPSFTPDGRHILFMSGLFFMSGRSGSSNIWRMDLDGGNHKQVTIGEGNTTPHCSPDGKWVVYISHVTLGTLKWKLMKIPLEGGDPVQLTDKSALRPAVSPDGKFVACLYWDEQPGSPWRLAIIPFEGGPPVKIFEVTPSMALRIWWTPDGQALTYVVTRNDISNIWSQPPDGSLPKQLTDFKSDLIYDFHWSRDGTLACSRGTTTRDVVLISNFR